jgi:hypothetical protein
LSEDEMKCSISDNGVGIDLVKNADKIFGMYKNSAIILNQKELAYSLQKNQVDAMNGNITSK